MDKIFFSTPSKTGRSSGCGYEGAMRELCYELGKSRPDLLWEMHTVGRGSVTQARDRAANDFRAGDYTKLVMVDDDMIFKPADLFRLIDGTSFLRPVTACLYPKRGFEWKLAPEIMRRGFHLADWISPMVMQPKLNRKKYTDDFGTWLEVDVVGGGFMCIHRTAFERLSLAHYEGTFADEGETIYEDPDRNRESVSFFKSGIYQRRNESEDTAFCRRWQKLGGELHAMIDARIAHQGEHIFEHAPLAD